MFDQNRKDPGQNRSSVHMTCRIGRLQDSSACCFIYLFYTTTAVWIEPQSTMGDSHQFAFHSNFLYTHMHYRQSLLRSRRFACWLFGRDFPYACHSIKNPLAERLYPSTGLNVCSHFRATLATSIKFLEMDVQIQKCGRAGGCFNKDESQIFK